MTNKLTQIFKFTEVDIVNAMHAYLKTNYPEMDDSGSGKVVFEHRNGTNDQRDMVNPLTTATITFGTKS
jgi:hypothetical protein